MEPLTFFAIMFGMSSAIGLVALGEAARDRRLTVSEILTGLYYVVIILMTTMVVLSPVVSMRITPPLTMHFDASSDIFNPTTFLIFVVVLALTFTVFHLLPPSTIVRLTTALLVLVFTYGLFTGTPVLEMLPLLLLIATLGVLVSLLLYVASSIAQVELYDR